MREFIPGLKLAGLFYREAVKPVLESHYPDLVHSAGLIGHGSEVLGFDTEMSTDHNWGPQVMIFLSDEDNTKIAEDLHKTLGYELPFTFHGYSTHFEEAADDPGSVVLKETTSRPINHRVQITTLDIFVYRYTGIQIDKELTVLDWFTVPEQNLRSLVTGGVYHDGLNVLEPMRRKLWYYPHDVWLYLLSAQWQRIGQEEPFMGRAGIVGDDIGSAVIADRLVRDIIRLALLMEKQYSPYSKWLGSAFAQLNCASRLTPILENVLKSKEWQERQENLAAAYEILAVMHNNLKITRPVPTQVSQFYNRPFMVIKGESIARVIWEAIKDEEVRALPYGVGKVDQYVDSTDILSYTERFRKLGTLYNIE